MTVLQRPVEFADLRLAPTSELAGLAELARLDDFEEVLRALMRIAETVRAEDEERARIRALRRNDEALPLPRRAAG